LLDFLYVNLDEVTLLFRRFANCMIPLDKESLPGQEVQVLLI